MEMNDDDLDTIFKTFTIADFHMVDINDVVHQFAPNSVGQAHGVKYQFESDRYIIKADMASGYLRIYDKVLRQYVKLDGTPGSLEETHFKIKKRSEM